MTDAPTLEADPYHQLRGVQRDHLLAAALVTADAGHIPTKAGTREAAGRLTGDTPAPDTTARAVDALEERQLVERVNGDPTPNARGVRVTDKGYRVLARGAARLDAAATMEGDA